MKKIPIILFLLITFTLYGQTPITFDRFSLDDNKNTTIQIIENEFRGKYTVNEWEEYLIEVDAKTTVEIDFEGNSISGIIIENREYKYSNFLELVQKLIDRHGEPNGSDAYAGTYSIYWWPEDPYFCLYIYISLEQPYVVKEMVYYGK